MRLPKSLLQSSLRVRVSNQITVSETEGPQIGIWTVQSESTPGAGRFFLGQRSAIYGAAAASEFLWNIRKISAAASRTGGKMITF